MIRAITHTLGTKGISMLLQVALLFITTKLMGAEVKGQIGLLVLNLTLIALLAGVIGGPALVYLTPRYRMGKLLLIGYGWSILMAPLGATILAVSGSEGFPGFGVFLLLALGEAALAVHAPILLGAKRVGAHNYSLLLKPLVTVAILVIIQVSGRNPGFDDFVLAYFVSLLFALAFSGIALARLPSRALSSPTWAETIRAAVKFGFPVQLGNVAQLLNYRLAFYLLEFFALPGMALVRIGIYSAVLQVSESVLQFSRSVAIVQYAEVSNIPDQDKSLGISLQLIKLNYTVTAMGLLILVLMPVRWYTAFLGVEFQEVKTHLYLLVPGLLALSVSSGFSHYFSGIGLHRLNTAASVAGLVLTAAVGIPAIATYGTYGAAATASIAYIALAVFQFKQLKRRKEVKASDLLLTRTDLIGFQKLFGNLLRRSHKSRTES